MNKSTLDTLVVFVSTVLISTAVALSDSTSAQPLNAGIYRHVNALTAYRIADGRSCIIVSESQLHAFGLHDKNVRIVDSSTDLTLGQSAVHACLWPEGFYYVRDASSVLQLQGNTACALPSTDFPVHHVTDKDDITQGRRFVGRCSPSAAMASGDAPINAQPLNPGAYRRQSGLTAYLIAGGKSCIIVSEAQLHAFGLHDESVQIVGSSTDLTLGQRTVHACSWPEGFYRVSDASYVLQLQGNTACTLPSTHFPIHRVTDKDNITQGRQFVGRCSPRSSP